METIRQGTFIITREDRAEDPKTIVREALRIGRLSDADVWLNHPKVSRLHAGINEIEGYFYLINLSASSATTLNGRVIPFNEAEALSAGDVIQIGPYFLNIENIDQESEKLSIRVEQQFALNVGERETQHVTERLDKQAAVKSRATGSSEAANSLKVFWDKRTREKAGRPSPLHPRTPPRPGKARFNWTPTRDLIRPWPFAIFIWAAIAVGTLSVLAVLAHKNAFAPDPLSDPHTRKTLKLMPAIAKQANSGSCTFCHALGMSMANKDKMNANCESCHKTESFVATIIPAHREAGITCTACHTEHQGEAFRPMNAALESCARCHNDQNKNHYNGKSVHTAHRGTYGYGYPVVDGVWVWKGLDAEELAQKPEVVAFLQKNRVNSNQSQQWRNAQFHGIHVNRIRVVEGVDGVPDDDGVHKVLSCSSCHKTGYMGANIDRAYPRTTCGRCHNAQVFNEAPLSSKRAETPSCTSCHVQHVRDTRWVSALRLTQQPVPLPTEITK